jgi:hypothetical protein
VLGNLERLETGTRRLSTLVAELFDLSRLLEGKRAPRCSGSTSVS